MKSRVIAANHLKQGNLSVKTSLSAEEIGSLIFVVVRCKWGLINERKCSKRCGAIRTKRKKYSLLNRRNSSVNMWQRPYYFLPWKILLPQNLQPVSLFFTLSSITNKARAYIFFFLNESAAIMSVSFDFGAIIIYLFGLIFWS